MGPDDQAGWDDKLNSPRCSPDKRMSRRIKGDPVQLCRACEAVAMAEDGPAPGEFLVVMVRLGDLYVNHGVDKGQGGLVQRPLVSSHMALNPQTFHPEWWERELPWAVRMPGTCLCIKCRRPQPGQKVSGIYHLSRGQHQSVGRRRYLEEFQPGLDADALMVPVRLFAPQLGEDVHACAARLFLESDAYRREQPLRTVRAVEITAGNPLMQAIARCLAQRGQTVTGGRGRFDATQGLRQDLEELSLSEDDAEQLTERVFRLTERAYGRLPKGKEVHILTAIFSHPRDGAVVEDDRLARLFSHFRDEIAGRGWWAGYRFVCEVYNGGWAGSVRRADKQLTLPPLARPRRRL